MTKDEALKLALSALNEVRQETFRLMRDGQTLYAEKKVWEAIYTIKEALAQPEQEPVAYLSNKRQRLNIELKPQTFVEIPTATDWEMPLYMKPSQRTWVGLSDEEINQLWAESHEDGIAMQQGFTTQQHYFAYLILRKAQEK